MSDEADKTLGMYQKWEVKRLHDPEAKHEHCDVFVLDLTHDPIAAEAALWYADQCEAEYAKLAADLITAVMKAQPRAVMAHMVRLQQLQDPYRS